MQYTQRCCFAITLPALFPCSTFVLPINTCSHLYKDRLGPTIVRRRNLGQESNDVLPKNSVIVVSVLPPRYEFSSQKAAVYQRHTKNFKHHADLPLLGTTQFRQTQNILSISIMSVYVTHVFLIIFDNTKSIHFNSIVSPIRPLPFFISQLTNEVFKKGYPTAKAIAIFFFKRLPHCESHGHFLANLPTPYPYCQDSSLVPNP